MRWQVVGYRTVVLLAVAGIGLSLSRAAVAQIVDSPAGVVVDAQGVLQKKLFRDPGGQLTKQRIAAAKASLNPHVAKFSKARWVSLNRLEQAILDRQGVPNEEMRYLAGLLRIQYVFYYPESKDIVVGGPAEGWVTNPAGRVVGITSGRPTLQLQDLAVALRAFPPGKRAATVIGCSIDPTKEGLASMQRFLGSVGTRFAASQRAQVTQYIVQNLPGALGMQTVSISGVPPDTHFAQVMVEADYRMKLIGTGLERPPVRMVSFIDKAQPGALSRNALVRWYFVPDYQCVRRSGDGLAMELVGDGVKLIGEDELVSTQGGRTSAGRQSKASRLFVTSFTKKYPELAERSPVYAELRNLIDLAVAAAYVQQEDFYTKAGWSMEFLGNEKAFPVRTFNAPRQVPPALGIKEKGAHLMTPIGGGVQIQPTQALQSSNLLPDEKGKVAEARQEVKPQLAKGQWWWD